MILDLYPDREARQFHGYEYASGCQNLFSGNNSERESLTPNEETKGGGQIDKGDEAKREKPTFNLSELKKA